MSIPATRFIEESIRHPDWLRTIEACDKPTLVKLAADQGFACSFDELRSAAEELLAGGKQTPATEAKVDEAASGLSDLETESGYGDDTGYAALYGVAGRILKLA